MAQYPDGRSEWTWNNFYNCKWSVFPVRFCSQNPVFRFPRCMHEPYAGKEQRHNFVREDECTTIYAISSNTINIRLILLYARHVDKSNEKGVVWCVVVYPTVAWYTMLRIITWFIWSHCHRRWHRQSGDVETNDSVILADFELQPNGGDWQESSQSTTAMAEAVKWWTWEPLVRPNKCALA